MERTLGPGSLSVAVTPWIALRAARASRFFSQFLRLREVFPPAFWKGVGPRLHFWRMYRNWTGGLLAVHFYDRLRSPAWASRFTITGTPPQSLPEWASRPVILTFLHAGGFPVVKSWLRAQGVPAAMFVGGLYSDFWHNRKYREEGDRAYGLEEFPHFFPGDQSLLKAARFLVPGHVLLISMEQRDFSKPRKSYPLRGATICLGDGAARLAAKTGAILMPASVRQDGLFRFNIHFGTPVPFVPAQEESSRAEANLHLAGELWRAVEEDPSGMTWTLMEALAPDLIQGRGQWP